MRRQLAAQEYRTNLAALAARRTHPEQVSNEDERPTHNYALNFTKGLPHDVETGLLKDNSSYDLFVRAIDSGAEADFIATPLGPADGEFITTPDGEVRAWESQGAGSAFDLQGPDAQAVAMPPAPQLGGPELVAEMAEVYAQAVLRDVPLDRLRALAPEHPEVARIVDMLRGFEWFNQQQLSGLTVDAERRRRTDLSLGTVFRGISSGDTIGPYLSQFLLIGTKGIGDDRSIADGLIQYGAQTISQKVPQAASAVDFMTDWNSWIDVQNGLDARGGEDYTGRDTFIATGRDLSTYVHFDALYQAYLNACLILLARNAPFDPGIPFQRPDAEDHQQGFAHFGPPHVLSLVTEVATRALKAVRFQKFNVHRRLRPEALAGRVERASRGGGVPPAFVTFRAQLNATGLLDTVEAHNGGTALLPMAFAEGSPMHPAYGAGHASVAGACITVLKAFFDHNELFAPNERDASKAFVASDDGQQLVEVDVVDRYGLPSQLTVEGELNKLAANISIARNWAGVHYFTDYWESLLLGERIAIQILQEQRAAFQENFSMTVPLFSGGTMRI